MEIKEKTNKSIIKYIHIAIIILGTIFISLAIFHNNIWFDESYSISMANRNFIEIWSIGSNDVHPVLYYWIIKIVNLIFGQNIMAYRFVSMIATAILGIIGYTHIRKDFGEKVGIIFSFLVYFLPINVVYSGEIRMYTWAMLFVSLMSIYAYRIYKNVNLKEENSNKIIIKNWILFAVFSLASCYTHYYGLVTAGIVNLMLFIYLMVKAIKERRENKIYTPELKRFTISAIVQIVLYLPWLMYFLVQFKTVSGGFWIPRPSWERILDIFIFQFSGNLDTLHIPNAIAICLGITVLAYVVTIMVKAIIKKKNVKEILPGVLAIGIYFTVFILIWAVSLKVPILYARYFLNLTGIFIFFIAFFMGKAKYNWLTVGICAIIMSVSTAVNINLIQTNYDESNSKPKEYVTQDIKENDVFVFGNEGSGFVLSSQLPQYTRYFFDGQRWNVEAAYKAFGPEMITIQDLEQLNDYKGRIWVINGSYPTIYEELVQKYGDKIKLIKQEQFSTKYQQYNYNITLIEKN